MDENRISDSLYEAMIAYYENKLSQEQADELLTWLKKDMQNKADFLETGKIWYASGLLSTKLPDTDIAYSSLLGKIRENNIRPIRKKTITFAISTIYKVAAAIFIIVTAGAGSFLLFNKKDGFTSDKYFLAEAPRGSRSVISLPDGSSVWLNSGTKLIYSAGFGNRTRDVTLEGEAFFSVAENKDVPFRVTASGICITALATSFNIKAYTEESIIETTLETGIIRIDNIDAKGRLSTTEPVFLKPNQKAIFIKSSGNLRLDTNEQAPKAKRNDVSGKIKPVSVRIDSLIDTKLTTSWKDSRWIFRSEKLSKLVPILERRYDVTINFRDTVLSNYKFTGTLKEESLEQVLNALTLAAPIRYEATDNQIYLYEDQDSRSRYKQQNR